MEVLEAIILLKGKAVRDDKPSKVNPSLTRKMVVEIIERPLLEGSASRIVMQNGTTLTDMYEKRVWQAVKDQRNPRY
ncbi:MAG: hypothetical protein ACYCZR_02140 [Burkholderiales bacterium]